MNRATPILGIDGDQWYLMTGDLMTGRAAFGHTIGEVKAEWIKRYNTIPIAPSPHMSFDEMTVAEYLSNRSKHEEPHGK